MDRFERSSLQSMKLSTQEYTIELSRGVFGAAIPDAPTPAAAEVSHESTSPCITAPLVGTYYAASAPDQSPFVAVGDRVAKGQTVCLIEAMKMMSEVPAPCDCVIEEILKANGDLVSFGEPLFRYRTV